MRLTNRKIEILSEISRDIAQVFFASAFIDPLFSDEIAWWVVITGLLLASACWGVSLFLTRE